MKRVESAKEEGSEVSIPFKRESLSKGIIRRCTIAATQSVSIPFKRESLSKGVCEKHRTTQPAFQFPSNGKAYPKTYKIPVEKMSTIEFQFPSNGKAYPKEKRTQVAAKRIKFQFPSNGKAYPKKTSGRDST